MIRSLVIFLPLFACVFSVLVHLKLASRTLSFAAFTMFMISLAAFLFTDCCYSIPDISHRLLMRATLAAKFTAPCTIPLLMLHYRRARGITDRLPPLELLWIVVPFILLTGSGVLYYLSGEDAVDKQTFDFYNNGYSVLFDYTDNVPLFLYGLISNILFRFTMTVEMLWFAIYIILLASREKFSLRNLYGFYFKGESVKTIGWQTLFMLLGYFTLLAKYLFLREKAYEIPAIVYTLSILLTFSIIGFAYTALFSPRYTITKKEAHNAFRYNYSPYNKAVIEEEMLDDLLDEVEEDALRRIQERISQDLHIDEFRSDAPFAERSNVAEQIFSAVSESWSEDRLLADFQKLMRDEMLFLQPRLSLDDVADKLGTNKFYVSKLVNQAYNLGFPELINTLRVDYAEQYILNHRDAKQEEIARNCGFLSASSFNTIFKKVTGVTPKVWVASQKHKDK